MASITEMFLFPSSDLTGSIDAAGTALPTWAIVLLAVSLSLLFVLIVVLVVIFCCYCVSRKQEKGNFFLFL